MECFPSRGGGNATASGGNAVRIKAGSGRDSSREKKTANLPVSAELNLRIDDGAERALFSLAFGDSRISIRYRAQARVLLITL